jgi:membrane-associated phospholipid phosphatase
VTTEAVKKSRAPVALLLLAGLLLTGAAVCFFAADERVFSYLRENPQTWYKLRWAEALKQLGRGYPLIWLLLVWVGLTGKHKTVIVCLLSLLITLAAVTVIKETVRRPRPRNIITAETKAGEKKDVFKSWSFPSGDAASVFAAAAVLAFAMPWPVTLVFAICCCGVTILRVVVLAHYPSDVLGGAATGILCGWSAISIRNLYPEIENIFKGRERILSFIGVILIPILIWLLQDLNKLIILLEFYAPIVLIMVIFDRLQTAKIETER